MSSASFNFKYKFPDNYNPTYVNGVFGGLNPSGEIIMNCFLERQPLPYAQTMEFDEEGNLTNIKITDPQDHNVSVLRYVSTGLVMNIETAVEIRDWLDHQITLLGESDEK